jgi:hypothetical protein
MAKILVQKKRPILHSNRCYHFHSFNQERTKGTGGVNAWLHICKVLEL